MSESANPYAAPGTLRPHDPRPPRLRHREEFTTPFRLCLWLMIGGMGAFILGMAIFVGTVGVAAMRHQSTQGTSEQTSEQRREGEQRRQLELQQDMQARMEGHLPAIIAGSVLYLAGLAAVIASAVFHLILLYRSWEVVQDGRARTTPGRAVGFMFIPIFNLYWFFVAKFGLAKDLNAFAERHAINSRPVSPGLGLACSILLLLSLIPLVVVFAIIPALVVLLLFLKQVTDACCDIVDHQAENVHTGAVTA